MAVYTQIDNPAEFFSVKIYSGSGSNTTVAHGLSGNAPDMFLIKRRNSTGGWINWNTGLTNNSYYMQWNNSDQQDNSTNNLQNTATTTTNISIGDQAFTNASGGTYVLYSWRAGTSFSNDASATSVGTIDSSGSVNTTAGFSIISYTGTGSAGTIAHGLGSVPAWILTKNRDASQPWRIYQKAVDASAPEDYGLILNNTTVRDNDNTAWNDTAPTSSVFSVGSSANTNNGSDDFIAYCFAEKKGYSKFGSFVGNGNANGPFIYTGFKPAWVMIKANDSENWIIFDNKRPGYNLTDALLKPNLNNVESTSGVKFDLLSNGFKARVSDAEGNSSGDDFIYMAFAEAPFVNSEGVPGNAR